MNNSCGCKRSPCGCCAGVEALTPLPIANRPGLDAIVYRAGTHPTFLETMKARLSSLCLGSDADCGKGAGNYPLRKLTTRDASDPAIAMLDAWAAVADVLTFYQERIANEGYLRTATERRSILELARLVGYRLRPGVAASVYLALTLDDGSDVAIAPFQVRAQSSPGPGETPQTFENTEALDARAQWNKLQPRTSRPQNAQTVLDAKANNTTANLYLNGVSTGLNQGDPLLIVTGGDPDLFRIIEVTPDTAANRTLVVISPWAPPAPTLNLAEREKLSKLIGEFEGPAAAKATLDALSAKLSSQVSDPGLADFITRETLPGLGAVASRRNIRADLRGQARRLASSIGEIANTLAGAKIADPSLAVALSIASNGDFDELKNVVPGLTKPASVPPANTLQLKRDALKAYGDGSDLGLQAFGAFRPQLRGALEIALANSPVTPPSTMEVYAMRVKAAPFGHNAPLRANFVETTTNTGGGATVTRSVNFSEWTADDILQAEDKFPDPDNKNDSLSDVIYLDSANDKILPDSWVVVNTGAFVSTSLNRVSAPRSPLLIARAADIQSDISRAAYGISGKSTRIKLADGATEKDAAWMKIQSGGVILLEAGLTQDDFQIIRRTAVYAQSEKLDLAEEPIDDAICGGVDEPIILDGVYSDLKSGRWVIISGERDDIEGDAGVKVSGVISSELAMISEIVHRFDSGLPGDFNHTQIILAEKLSYCYRRDTVTIFANVVNATHGESRGETPGSGDGSKVFQQFGLRQSPLTYVSASTPEGVASTLKIFVNDLEWHEAESLLGLAPGDRVFTTRQSDDDVTTAVFGNGKWGARLPTGVENVRAEYRQGIGKAGNVEAGQITLLASRPLGVNAVVNPLRASGGADKETRDQARKNAPLAIAALDRLVSTQDYEDFARVFAGVGKSFAIRLSDGRRELVHVTIAGVEDIPIDESSDLFRNLSHALRRFGDPALPIQLATRELTLLIISANVHLLPDYEWEKVAPNIRVKLLDTFSFDRRELGQDALLSEALSAMQSVAGVAYVDVDAFGGVAEKNADGSVRTPKELLDAAQAIVGAGYPSQRVRVNLPELSGAAIRPAQLAYLTPDAPDTLILNQI
ncbi:MAG: putative baseplate assembly protein [Chloracidobacterium sp.]|nr:putative baseplate assembly protein [Chloracidobacterium sp.]